MATLPKTKIFLDTYHPTTDSTCAIKLEVYFDRKRKHYPTPHRLTPENYKLMLQPEENPDKKHKKALQEVRDDLIMIEAKAKTIVNKLQGRFAFSLFEKEFIQLRGNSNCAFVLMEERAKALRLDGKISTAVLQECALKSIKTFHTKKTLPLESIDVAFLKGYEKWMREAENSPTTIGMYIRTVRTIFNEKIEDGIIAKELYPFKGKRGYSIPTGRNIKKALPKDTLAALYNYEPETKNREKALDFWLFSLLGNGANLKDILRLKFKNIDGDMIRFQRAKNDPTNREEPITISFAVTPDIKRIMKKWGNKSIYAGNYIFPVLDNKMTPEEEYKAIQLFTKFVNKNMQKIAKDLNITAHITSYSARHSFSTVLKNSGRSVAEIGEALGHKNIKTTQNYLASFDDESKKEVAEVLVNFIKVNKAG